MTKDDFTQERDAALQHIVIGLPLAEEWEAEKLSRLAYLLVAANTDPELQGLIQALHEILPRQRLAN